MSRPKDRGLTYLRRSTDKQEISLPRQLEWAIAAARQHGVALDAAPADLAHMQAERLHTYKGIRLDDGISGSDLTRPGFLAFNGDALEDASVSHVFFYKRDRFARPDDAAQVMLIEKKLLLAGITVVHSDGVRPPLRRGDQNIVCDLELLLAYYQGGEELRKHAERVLGFQKTLAEGGYRVGGNPPYGFVRVLVDAGGNVLEELPRGKTVRQPGCHVRVMPKDVQKVAVWLQLLEYKERGWGCKRIAKRLNDLGIPSPDAGHTRTDHGVRHKVSGKWSHNTVAELCRNPIILGVQQYGKRSEGKIRRLGAEGARLLDEDKDLTAARTVRTVVNDESLRINKQVGEAKFDAQRWQAIQEQMDQRGSNQRGIPRAKDPARYPLACRLVDLTDGCGSFLHGRTNQGRAVYTCGRYMQTSGSECSSNHVDGEAMLRFTLKTLRQLIDRHGNRDKLRQKLLERARRESREPAADPRAAELGRLTTRRADLEEQLRDIERRMVREREDSLYEVFKRHYLAARSELSEVAEALRRLESRHAAAESQSPESQAEAALGLLDDLTRITSDPAARAEVNPLLRRLGLRIGLTFGSAVKGKKRVVRRLASGRMVFGDGPLPVPLFGRDNAEGGPSGCGHGAPIPADAANGIDANQERLTRGDAATHQSMSDVSVRKGRKEKQSAEEGAFPSSAAASGDRSPDRPNESQLEGISITKVNRGEPRCTFPSDLRSIPFLSLAMVQVEEFTADTFFALAATIDWVDR